ASSVTPCPRRISSEARPTAAVAPNSFVTASSERTASPAPGSPPPMAGPDLLHHRLGDVLRLDDLGQILLGVDLEQLGVLGRQEIGIPRLDAETTAVRLHFPRPGPLRALRQEPVDEHSRRVRLGRFVDRPDRVAEV